MKKCIAIFLCACTLLALSVTAFAAEHDTDYWKELYGIPEPRYEDYEDSDVYKAAWDAWHAGFSTFFFRESQKEFDRQAEEAAQKAVAEEIAAQEAIREQKSAVESVPTQESSGVNDEKHSSSVEDNTSSEYPIGSYVDSAGVVWSPDGTQLSPNNSPGLSLVASPDEGLGLSSENPLDSFGSPAAEDFDALAVIAGLVSDIATDPPIWYVEDLRPTDNPVEVLEGLKALVVSIFGEYAPVTTTSVISQTVGNDTQQYLIETVAPGAAGVDYEWLAGVFLFGIMLFCLMKLLGGVLK